VKRNGKDDLLRCQMLAHLLMLGKEGRELEDAAKSLEANTQTPAAQADFSENDKIPSLFRPSLEMPGGNFVVGFPQSYTSCYPGATEYGVAGPGNSQVFSFETTSTDMGWELGNELQERSFGQPFTVSSVESWSSSYGYRFG
jgi:hypothetical protein